MSNKLDKKDVETLYTTLIKHKKKLLEIDEKINSQIGNLITLTIEAKDTTELTEALFYNSFNNTLPILKLAVYKNRITRIEEMILRFCTFQYSTSICGYEQFQAILSQNSTHFKLGEKLEIYAGIGAFSRTASPKVFINDEEIKLNTAGVTEYKTKVSQQKGTYKKKVKIEYIKPNGTAGSVEKEIIYTVDE
jgi:hypothetical protein